MNDKEVEIWAELKIANKNTGEEIVIKSDITTEMLCDAIFENIFGRLIYKKINFDKCVSHLEINIDVFGDCFPVMDINRVYLQLLNDINSDVTYNISICK